MLYPVLKNMLIFFNFVSTYPNVCSTFSHTKTAQFASSGSVSAHLSHVETRTGIIYNPYKTRANFIRSGVVLIMQRKRFDIKHFFSAL